MTNFRHNLEITIGTLTVLIVATILFWPRPEIQTIPSEFHTFYYGSASAEHDQIYGGMVDGDLTYGLYCQDTSELIHSDTGDVYITGRAGSAEDCRYVSEGLLGIAIVGWGNVEEHVTERPENSLSISNGGDYAPGAYGEAVDFNVVAASLSEAMPLMANIVMELNAATSTPMTTAQVRYLLIESSDGWLERDGKRYGRVINLERAIDYVVNGMPIPPSEPCVDCGWLPGAVYSLLLLED